MFYTKYDCVNRKTVKCVTKRLVYVATCIGIARSAPRPGHNIAFRRQMAQRKVVRNFYLGGR